MPALPRRHRPPVARGGRPHPRPRHDAHQSREGLRIARRQGGALGALQLQPAEPPAVRRAVRHQPVPLRDPDQQPGDDRRPGQLAGGGSALPRGGDQGRAGRALRRGGGPRPDPLELPQQGMGADRHPRHPGPRAGAGGHARAGRRRRGDRDPGRPRPVAAPGRAVRHAPLRGRRTPRPLGDRRAGEVRRPRAELPQRPRPDLPPRGRRDHRGRMPVDLQRPVRDRGRAAGPQGPGRRPGVRSPLFRRTPACDPMAPPARWS